MRYLLDTHTLLWSASAKERLSQTAKQTIENNKGGVFVSQISLWEIAINHKIGKLPDFDVTFEQFIETVLQDGFLLLSLQNSHLTNYFNLDFFIPDHKDPFDRLLIATADYEQMSFITKDEKFDAYKDRVNIIW